MAFFKKKDVTLDDLVSEKANPNVDVLDVDLGYWVGYFARTYQEAYKDSISALKGYYKYLSRDDVLKLMLSVLSDLMLDKMLENKNEEYNEITIPEEGHAE